MVDATGIEPVTPSMSMKGSQVSCDAPKFRIVPYYVDTKRKLSAPGIRLLMAVPLRFSLSGAKLVPEKRIGDQQN